MLRIKIFEVDHGFCAAIDTGDPHLILIDCGYNSRGGFHPTRYLLERLDPPRQLRYLILPTFKEGHLGGFYDLIAHSLGKCFSFENLLLNPSIDAESLPELVVRNFSAHHSLHFLTDLSEQCGNVERTIHVGEAKLSFFWNTFPEFLDFSNLSLVIFLSAPGINILFPGNVTANGWQSLLRNSKFRNQLRQVNVFVASHYGQQEGYCFEVFNYCRPELIIISNHHRQQISPVIKRQYERQIRTAASQPRILTTSQAGDIVIQQMPDYSIQVRPQRVKSYLLQRTEFSQR